MAGVVADQQAGNLTPKTEKKPNSSFACHCPPPPDILGFFLREGFCND